LTYAIFAYSNRCMSKIKSKHNNLLNYFLYDHKYLSKEYLKKCKKFFKELKLKEDIKNMDKKTELKELSPTVVLGVSKKQLEEAKKIKQKEDNFLEYLGFDRSDLNDDGSDLEELKNLGGFQNFNERLKK